ncbi:MAG: putative metal-binding motif-containing protein [Myxococcales bacterium]|nr:putative metal-binding motif-containing protein [Myxococcales bacterium]
MRTALRCAKACASLVIFLAGAQGCGSVDPLGVEGDVGGVAQCPQVACDSGERCVSGVCVAECVDADGDGFGDGCEAGPDCDDSSASISPDSPEIPGNQRDDDCDYFVDEVVACTSNCSPGERSCTGGQTIACVDAGECWRWGLPQDCEEGATCVDGECTTECVDADGDGAPVNCPGQRDDCDDGAARVFPGAPELCDGADNNCNGRVDELGVCSVDCEDECVAGTVLCTSDGTAWVECIAASSGCTVWATERRCGSTRTCVDGECVGVVRCVDADGDGFGPGCDAGPDCRPTDPQAYPGAAELCDGVDQSCDGVADDGGVCRACAGGTAAAPAEATSAGFYRVSCAATEYVLLTEVARGAKLAAVVSAASGAVSVRLGSLTGGRFAADTAGFSIGGDAGVVSGSAPADAALEVTLTAGVAYTVGVTRGAAGCPADAYEPNDAPTAPTLIGAGPLGAGLTRCDGDADYIELEVPAGAVLSATATFDRDTSDSVVRVLWNGAEVGTSTTGPFVGGGPQGRASHFRADLPGAYTVAVRQRTGSGPGEYALAVQTRGFPTCRDDSSEGTGAAQDDIIANAQPLARGATRDGVICPGDIDVISVGSLSAGASYTAEFDGQADIDFLIVRDTLRSVLFSGESDDVNTAFTSNVSASGSYYVVVFGRDPSTTGRYQYTHRF